MGDIKLNQRLDAVQCEIFVRCDKDVVRCQNADFQELCLVGMRGNNLEKYLIEMQFEHKQHIPMK